MAEGFDETLGIPPNAVSLWMERLNQNKNRMVVELVVEEMLEYAARMEGERCINCRIEKAIFRARYNIGHAYCGPDCYLAHQDTI